MKTHRMVVFVITAMALTVAPGAAQEPEALELTQYTPELRWQRSALQATLFFETTIARAKERAELDCIAVAPE